MKWFKKFIANLVGLFIAIVIFEDLYFKHITLPKIKSWFKRFGGVS